MKRLHNFHDREASPLACLKVTKNTRKMACTMFLFTFWYGRISTSLFCCFIGAHIMHIAVQYFPLVGNVKVVRALVALKTHFSINRFSHAVIEENGTVYSRPRTLITTHFVSKIKIKTLYFHFFENISLDQK